MKTLVILLVSLLVLVVGGLAAMNFAVEQDTRVVTHGISGSVREIVVTSDSGDVDLVPGDGRVVVRETRHYVFDEPTLEQDLSDGVLTLKPRCNGFAFNCSTDLRVSVPKGVKISVEADSGDVEGRRISARDVHVEIDSGDIGLELIGRQALVWAHADSGDVDLVAPGARAIDAEADSGSLRIDAGGPPRRIVAHADSGDVEVTVPRGAYALEAEVDSGDVDVDDAISRNDAAPNAIDARADSGNVSVRAR